MALSVCHIVYYSMTQNKCNVIVQMRSFHSRWGITSSIDKSYSYYLKPLPYGMIKVCKIIPEVSQYIQLYNATIFYSKNIFRLILNIFNTKTNISVARLIENIVTKRMISCSSDLITLNFALQK